MSSTRLFISLFYLIALTQAKYLCTKSSKLSINALKNPTTTEEYYTLGYKFTVEETTKDRFGQTLFTLSRVLEVPNYLIAVKDLAYKKDETKIVVHFVVVEENEEEQTYTIDEQTAIEANLVKATMHFMGGGFDIKNLQPFPYTQDYHLCESKSFNISFFDARLSPQGSNKSDGKLHLYFSIDQSNQPYKVAEKAGKVKPYFDHEIENLNKQYNFEQFEFFSLGK